MTEGHRPDVDRLAALFARWRATRRPGLLAQVFDDAAPELMRVALHVSADVADAEDLVQGTFLAAIESAERFDPSRPLLPWLSTILTNRAKAEQRRARRVANGDAFGEVERLASLDAEPGESVARRELSGAALAAIDALPEPYRQPIVLRVLHGMAPAAIAHALGRSPATVRSQIHRGVEMLRKRLPVGVLGLLAGVSLGERGLAAVRAEVLAHAAESVTTGSLAGLLALGGAIVTKKVVLVAAGLLLAGFAAWLGFGGGGDSAAIAPQSTGEVVGVHTRAGSEPTRHETVPERAERAAPRSPVAAAYEDIDRDLVLLRGRVVDGPTRSGIAGARVDVFAPRRMTLLEMQREFADIGVPYYHGQITSRVRWLRVPFEAVGPQHVAGDEALDLPLPPAAGTEPIETMRTDAEGRFAVPSARHGRFLHVVLADGSRRLALLQPDEKGESPEEVEIEVWPTQRFTGRVVTAAGEVPPAPIHLRVYARHADPVEIVTAVDGSFAFDAPAENLGVTSAEPGWIVTGSGIHPERKVRWVFPTNLTCDAKRTWEGTLCVRRLGGSWLHVTDAQSGAPIETVRLLGRSDKVGRTRYLSYCGQFHAPNGMLELTAAIRYELDAGWRNEADAIGEVAVWAEGYEAATVHLDTASTEEREVVPVRLHRGPLSAVHGFARSGGEPVAGARVSLCDYDGLNWDVGEDNQRGVASVVTGEDGSFRLAAPTGQYMLHAAYGAESTARLVVVPGDAPVDIDFAENCYVVVELVDASGAPMADHNVAVDSPFGKKVGRTDTDGRFRCGPFREGELEVRAPFRPSETSWVPEVERTFVATRGDDNVVQLCVTAPREIRARLVRDGSGFEDFTARDVRNIGSEAVAVEPDGDVPFSLLAGSSRLRIQHGERTWDLEVPEDAPDSWEIELRADGPTYFGVLVDAAGDPVRAHLRFSGGGRRTTVPTDGRGAFRVSGLAEESHHVAIDLPGTFEDQVWSYVNFDATSPPTEDGTELRMQLPSATSDTVEVHGTVRDIASGEPIPSAIVSALTSYVQVGGELQCSYGRWVHSNVDGSYSIRTMLGGDARVLLVSPEAGVPMQRLPLEIPPNVERFRYDVDLER